MSVPFPQQMLMSAFCRDILQRKLMIPGDAARCYILASTSKPLTQNPPPGSQNLPFSTSSFNLSCASLQMAWGWPFHFAATSTALFKGKMKTNSFKCFCKTSVVSERPFTSQQLLWGGEEAGSWGSSPCFARQSTVFKLTNPLCVSQWVFHSATRDSFVWSCKANCKPETA